MNSKEIGVYAFVSREKLIEIFLKKGETLIGSFGVNKLGSEMYKKNQWKFLITSLSKEIIVEGDDINSIAETEKVFL